MLLAVVAVIVIASFSQGSLITKIHDSSEDYFNSVTRVIMGENPKPIPGGWCPVTCPQAGSFGFDVMYGACECPAPAFGGTCPDTGIVTCGAGQTCKGFEVTCGTPGKLPSSINPCGPCPTGQVCVAVTTDNPTGCACSNGLTCNGQGKSPKNSLPDESCTQCACPQYSSISCDGSSCDYCPKGQYLVRSGDPGWNPTYCSNGSPTSSCLSNPNVVCNSTGQCSCSNGTKCDANKNMTPSKDCSSCDCYLYTYYNAAIGACSYCQAGYASYDGKTCVPVQCPKNSSYNQTTQTCDCYKGSKWSDTLKQCVYPCSPIGTCPGGQTCTGGVCL